METSTNQSSSTPKIIAAIIAILVCCSCIAIAAAGAIIFRASRSIDTPVDLTPFLPPTENTAAPAPTVQPSPRVTPRKTMARAPIQTPSSTTIGSAPATRNSSAWSGLRMMPATESPRADSSPAVIRAILPCPPAMTTRIGTPLRSETPDGSLPPMSPQRRTALVSVGASIGGLPLFWTVIGISGLAGTARRNRTEGRSR